MEQATKGDIENEARRLHEKLGKLGWNLDVCKVYAPITLEINRLKEEKGAVILAHSYQTPDIIYGVADFTGDSFGLSKKVQETDRNVIVFAGVKFMAETAKILNPGKTVLLPDVEAGCSLADNITGGDVRRLKEEHPDAAVVCYVNTSADVKAESDVCCTSANAGMIIRNLPNKKIIFVPDNYMGKNLANETDKEIVIWDAYCIVHKEFTAEKAEEWRRSNPGLKILAHTECSPNVIAASDFAGGTGDMIRYVKTSQEKTFMLVTECGLADRMRVEVPEKEFIGMCGLCPYMKKITLLNILQAMRSPRQEQIIEIPEDVRARAERSLNRMFELSY